MNTDGHVSGDSADGKNVPDGLRAEIADLQAFVASLPGQDSRSPEEIIGYDEDGLPS